MRITVSNVEAPASFVPKELTIRIESKEEGFLLRHLVSCWVSQDFCHRKADVKNLADRIQNVLIDQGIFSN